MAKEGRRLLFTDKKGRTAEYIERWETIYAEKKFSKPELDRIKEDLVKDGYKVVHIVVS